MSQIKIEEIQVLIGYESRVLRIKSEYSFLYDINQRTRTELSEFLDLRNFGGGYWGGLYQRIPFSRT